MGVRFSNFRGRRVRRLRVQRERFLGLVLDLRLDKFLNFDLLNGHLAHGLVVEDDQFEGEAVGTLA